MARPAGFEPATLGLEAVRLIRPCLERSLARTRKQGNNREFPNLGTGKRVLAVSSGNCPQAGDAGSRGAAGNRLRPDPQVTGHFFRLHLRPWWREAEATIGEFFRKMARPAGFEPATLGLEGRPSDPAVSGAIRFQARTRKQGNNRELGDCQGRLSHLST